MHTYPYENKLSALLPGEVWRDVPGFEGYYQASSLGRIRSVDRTIPHPRLGSQFVRGRVMSQSVARNRNLKTGLPMVDLRVTLAVENVQYYFNVRRLVYETFVSPLNYDDDGLYVINKDGDGFNNRVENLELVTRSVKQKRVFERDRQDSYLRTADRSTWGKEYGGATRRKAVEQLTLAGEVIARYESMSEARRVTGCGDKEIGLVAKGVLRQTGGFKWRFI